MFELELEEYQRYEDMKEAFELCRQLNEEMYDSEYGIRNKREFYRIWRMV